MGASTGIHTMPADEYHADPAWSVSTGPSLSASIASILCSQSPAHAWAAHPRLNPRFKREDKGIYDVGTVAHAILLEGADVVTIVDADDWRTKAAREARDEAREQGKVPLLSAAFSEVQAMVESALAQLADHDARPPLLQDGKPEQTLVWEEPGGVVCRARLDWLRDDHLTIDDFKTTSRSANPEAYSRALFGVGGDVQAAFYIRGVQMLTGAVPEFRWVIQETYPPYCLSVVACGPDVLTIGRKKVEYALELWRKCLAADDWPGYGTRVAYAELPAYEEAKWLERELRGVAA